MKILTFVTLYLISGRVECSDVIGYSGGGVIIHSDVFWDLVNNTYICKVNKLGCTDIIRSDTRSSSVQGGKFTLYKGRNGYLKVLIRHLKPQDEAAYRIGLGNQKHYDVNLKIHNDSCCGQPKVMNMYLGQNSSFVCNYPENYRFTFKYIYKLDNKISVKEILNTTIKSQNGRFAISDNKARVIVNISDVREKDEGVYLCGIRNNWMTVKYRAFFQEIELQVTGTYRTTSAALTVIPSDVQKNTPGLLIIIIIIIILVALILIGGLALLFYKLRHVKIQVSATPFQSPNNINQATSDYENDLINLPKYENEHIKQASNYQNLHFSTKQPVYQSLNPQTLTKSIYETLHV